MTIHYGYENLAFHSPVVTTGIFDGVHLGHRSLLNFLIKRAREIKGESIVVTFSPHPRLVLEQNHTGMSFLTTGDEKIALLEKAGIDHLIIIEFTKEFSRIDACTFVSDILVEKIGIKHLVIGYDHHFGSRGEGDFDTIRQCSESSHFVVEQVQEFLSSEGSVSSSAIREALIKGRIDEANAWLGYNYTLSGTVTGGRQIGRSIGFPTANILPEDDFKLIPCNGVYAVEVRIGDEEFKGMLNIGSNPTVNNDPGKRSIEVNILDFDEDIYGRKITVIFRKRLRDEMKFEGIEQLKEQIKLDRIQIMKLFD
jgi:riboflavin kinase / FMN adenylyltransferase